MNIKVTRAKLESLVEDMVKDSLEPVRVALKDSGLAVGEIDDVILVGGQTRMPLVQRPWPTSSAKSRAKTSTRTKPWPWVLPSRVPYCPVTRPTYCCWT